MTIAAPGRPSGEPLANGTRTWRDIPLWRYVPEEKWNDWRWQAGHAVKSLEELHLLFEQANKPFLQAQPVDPEALVFPHGHFLGRGS